MADICTELRKQLHELDVLRKSCGSLHLKEGMESDAAKETIGKFDTLAEELRDAAVFYKQPYNECLKGIEWKIKNKKNLTKWECRVLYRVDSKHPGGINAIDMERQLFLEKRRSDKEKKQDLALVFDTTSNRISLTEEEALSGNIRYHYGDLDLEGITDAQELKDLTLPEEVSGNMDLYHLISAEGFTLPRKIGGTLDLSNLTSAEKLTLPEEINLFLYIQNLTTVQGIIKWPSNVGGAVYTNIALPPKEAEKLRKRYPNKVVCFDSDIGS